MFNELISYLHNQHSKNYQGQCSIVDMHNLLVFSRHKISRQILEKSEYSLSSLIVGYWLLIRQIENYLQVTKWQISWENCILYICTLFVHFMHLRVSWAPCRYFSRALWMPLDGGWPTHIQVLCSLKPRVVAGDGWRKISFLGCSLFKQNANVH